MKSKSNLFLTAAISLVFGGAASAADTYQWDPNDAAAGLGGSATWNGAAAQWDLVGTGADDGTDATVAYSNLDADTYNFGGTAGTVTFGTATTLKGAVNFTTSGYTIINNVNSDTFFSGLVTAGGGGLTTFSASGGGFGDFKFNGGLSISTGATAKIGVRGNAANAISRIGTSDTAALSGAGSLQFYGDNIIDVWGVNTGFTGTVDISMTALSDGIRLRSDGCLGSGDITLTKGYLNLNATTIGNNLILNSTPTNIAVSGAGGTLGGIVSESGGARDLNVTSSLTLSNTGNHTYTGATNITTGTLTVLGSISASSAVSIGSGTTLALSGNGAALGDITIAEGGTLDTTARTTDFALGSGQVLTAGRTSSPSTDIEGNIGSAGTISPAGNGVIGTLTINGGLELAGGTVEIDLGAGNTADLIDLNSAGEFVASAATVINLSGAGANVPGTYTLVVNSDDNGATFDNLIDPSNLSVTGTTLTPSWDATISGTLKLVLSAASADLTWNGTAAPGNIWDTDGGNTNWLDGGAAPFANGDQVTFDGSAAENIVDIPGTVSPLVMTVSGANNITFSGTGSIAGTALLTKSGTSNLTINTTNTFSGGTVINDGTVTLGHATDTLFDTGDIAVAGGTLDIGANSDTVGAVTLTSGSISGTGGTLTGSSFAVEDGSISAILDGPVATLTKTSAGSLILSSDNTYGGDTTISEGTLQLGNGGTSGSVYGNIINNGGLVIDRSDSLAIGILTGNGALTVTGGGSVDVSNAVNTSALTLDNSTLGMGSKNLAVNGFTVQAAGGAITGSGNLTLNAGMTLNGDATISPTIVLGGNSTWSGAGVLTLNAMTINGAAGGNTTLTSNPQIKLGGSLVFQQSANNNDFIFNGGFDLNGNNLTVKVRNTLNGSSPSSATGVTGNGDISLANELNTFNTGRFILKGTNTFTGTTTVDGIILDLKSATALGDSTSVLTINATNPGNTTVIRNSSGAALTLANNNAMNWNGDFTFSGDTARTGTSSGTTRDLNMGTGAVTLDDNRIVTTTARTLTIGGVIGDGGNAYTLTKSGAGNLALDGANTYTGATTVTAGNLGGNGSIPGALTIQADAGLYAKITDWTGTAGSGYADLSTGAITIDSGSHTVLIDTTGLINFTESAKTFTIVNASGISGFVPGDFSITTTGGFAGTGTWSIQQTGNSLELVYAASTPTGGYYTWALTNAPTGNANDDFDNDGVPNAVEYVLGGDKDTNDIGKLPTIDTTGGNLTFSFIRPWDSIGLVDLSIEVSTDLATWPDKYPVADIPVVASPGVTVTDNGNSTDTVTLVIPQTPDSKKFARLNVVVTP